MKKMVLFLVLLVFCFALAASGQTAFRIKVIDSITNNPIKSPQIEIFEQWTAASSTAPAWKKVANLFTGDRSVTMPLDFSVLEKGRDLTTLVPEYKLVISKSGYSSKIVYFGKNQTPTWDDYQADNSQISPDLATVKLTPNILPPKPIISN